MNVQEEEGQEEKEKQIQMEQPQVEQLVSLDREMIEIVQLREPENKV